MKILLYIFLYLFIGWTTARISCDIWFRDWPSRKSLVAFLLFPYHWNQSMPTSEKCAAKELPWYNETYNAGRLGSYFLYHFLFWPIRIFLNSFGILYYGPLHLINSLGKHLDKLTKEPEFCGGKIQEYSNEELLEFRKEARKNIEQNRKNIEKIDETLQNRAHKLDAVMETIASKALKTELERFDKKLQKKQETNQVNEETEAFIQELREDAQDAKEGTYSPRKVEKTKEGPHTTFELRKSDKKEEDE